MCLGSLSSSCGQCGFVYGEAWRNIDADLFVHWLFVFGRINATQCDMAVLATFAYKSPSQRHVAQREALQKGLFRIADEAGTRLFDFKHDGVWVACPGFGASCGIGEF